MPTERETTRIVRSWLEEGRTALPDHILDAVLDQLPATPQRRSWWPARRIADMNTYAKLAIAAATVLVLAVVGINLLPGGSDIGVGGPAVPPTPSPSSSSPGANVWPTGALEVGRHDASLLGVPFSFTIPSPGWRSNRGMGSPVLETGSFQAGSYAWFVFGGPFDAISTDPCGGGSAPIGQSMAAQATAFTTIPGTDAVGPTDVTVGGLPAKLVVLTILDDIPCATNKFWLYGPISLYPNSLASTIRIWTVDVDGKVLVIHSDQAGPNPELEQEIEQIIDSIEFK